MEPYRHRILFCIHSNDNKPSCQRRGADQSLEMLRQEISKQGLRFEIKITKTSCLGLCSLGPNLVVLPQGIWYSNMQPQDMPEFVSQLALGKIYKPKVWEEGKLKSFFENKIALKKNKNHSGS